MELKKEYREILNQLDPEEKRTVLGILEKTDAVISKEKKKQKAYEFVHTVRESLKHNFLEWFVLTYVLAFVLMVFLSIHNIRCAAGSAHILNAWSYEFYLENLRGHNLFYGLWQIIIVSGQFSILVYILAWVYSAIGFFVINSIHAKSWAETRWMFFDYLNCREQYASLDGFDVRKEREEMRKWAKSNRNYHFYGSARNKNK